jgi:Tol biopolymer transport system component
MRGNQGVKVLLPGHDKQDFWGKVLMEDDMFMVSNFIKKLICSPFFRRVCALVLVSIFTLTFVIPSRAAPVLLNRRIGYSLHDNGDVRFFKISPDGRYVVFTADRHADEVVELYSVPIHGGEPVKLNGTLPAGGNVLYDEGHEFQISSDSSRVIYLAEQEVNEMVELFSVPIVGGESVKLNSALVADGDVDRFTLSPVSGMAVYRADQTVNNQYELYSIPIMGGVAPARLNKAFTAGMNVQTFAISPNGAWVVYRANQDFTNRTELFRNAIAGGDILKLHEDLEIGRSIWEFKITPNSAGVVFRGELDSWMDDLYGTWMNGSTIATPYKYSSLPDDTRSISAYEISPDSNRVVYLADQGTSDVVELYSNSILAGDPHKLNAALPADAYVYSFEITPNSGGALYLERYNASTPPTAYMELYSNFLDPEGDPFDDGPFHLNDALPTGAFGAYDYQSTNNSLGVIYVADQDTPRTAEIYNVPITGSAGVNTKLNTALWTGGYVSDFLLMPTGGLVIYKARQDSYNMELFLVATTGGAHVKLSGTCATICEVYQYDVTSDGQAVVYISGQNVVNQNELYVSFYGYERFLPLLFK